VSRSAPRGTVPDPCPICSRPADPQTKPFCSARCAEIDLGRWLGERYVIPAPDDDEADRPPPHRDDKS